MHGLDDGVHKGEVAALHGLVLFQKGITDRDEVLQKGNHFVKMTRIRRDNPELFHKFRLHVLLEIQLGQSVIQNC